MLQGRVCRGTVAAETRTVIDIGYLGGRWSSVAGLRGPIGELTRWWVWPGVMKGVGPVDQGLTERVPRAVTNNPANNHAN